MPQPAFLTAADARYRQRQIMRFGNLPVWPTNNVQGWLDLNDGIGWHATNPKVTPRKVISLEQLAWQGEMAVVAIDLQETRIKSTLKYDEQASGVPVQQARSGLWLAGLQWLTFDNLTGFQAHVSDMGDLEPQGDGAAPYLWTFDCEWFAPFGGYLDMTTTNLPAQPVALGGGNPVVNTDVAVTYAGSWWAKPVWTITLPNPHTSTVNAITIANITSGETCTIVLPVTIPSTTARTFTIDCGTKTIVDDAGTNYDIGGGGTFPRLWPNGGNAQTIRVTIGTVSGATTGITLSGTWTNRWTP